MGLNEPGGLQKTSGHGTSRRRYARRCERAVGRRRTAIGRQEQRDGNGTVAGVGFPPGSEAKRVDAVDVRLLHSAGDIELRTSFAKAAQIFVSPDGHAARYLVQTNLSPFTTEAMDQVNSITNAARSAQPNTALEDADISMTGFSATLRDTRDYYNHDVRLIMIATITSFF